VPVLESRVYLIVTVKTSLLSIVPETKKLGERTPFYGFESRPTYSSHKTPYNLSLGLRKNFVAG
jgi:hypothetical protein